MKPIEPGCLAIVLGCAIKINNGLTTTVGKFLGEIPPKNGYRFKNKDLWETETKFETNLGNQVNMMSGQYLVRIDGFEENEDEFDDIIIKEIEHATSTEV